MNSQSPLPTAVFAAPSCLRVRAFLTIFACLATWAQAHPGDGLIVDSQDAIYFGWVKPFVNRGRPAHHACVWKLDAGAAEPQPLFRSDHAPRKAQSSNIWVTYGLDGRIYCRERQYLGERNGKDVFVTDVWLLAANGEKKHLLGPVRGRSGFGGAFAVDRNGAMYHVTERCVIHRRNPDGSSAVLAGGARGYQDGKGGEAQFENISCLAWGSDEMLYVSDHDKIRRLKRDGTVTTLADGLFDLVKESDHNHERAFPLRGRIHFFDMTVNKEGDVFGADWGTRQVIKISSKGEKSIFHRSPSPWSPEGIAAKGDALYLLETTAPERPEIRPRVRKLNLDSTTSTLFEVPANDE